MIRKLKYLLFIACAALLGASVAGSQVLHAGEQTPPPFRVGVGASAFTPDFHDGTMLGVTLWGDYTPRIFTHHVDGLSVSAELRDLNYHRSASQTDLREDTYLGGFTYQWRRFNDWRPYARGMLGYGTIRFGPIDAYTNDSRTISSYGGGVDFRLDRNLWLRADYEYQRWPALFNRNLHPQGVTVGLVYDFHWRLAQ